MITCDYYGSVFLRRNITPVGMAECNDYLPVALSFDITPNPIKDGVATLHYHLSKPEPLRIQIYDISGRTVLSQTLSVNQKASRVNLDLHCFNTGVYLLRIETNGFSKTNKLVITQ